MNLNDRSMNRISYHTTLEAQLEARLSMLAPESKAYVRCVNRLNKCREILQDVQSKLAQRLADPTSLKRPRDGESFDIVCGDEPDAFEGMVKVSYRVCKHEAAR